MGEDGGCAELAVLVGGICLGQDAGDLVGKALVRERVGLPLLAEARVGGKELLCARDGRVQLEDGLVRDVALEVRVAVAAVASLRDGIARGVGAEQLHAVDDGEEVAGGLAHLLVVQLHVAVRADALRPALGLVGPDGGVVEDGERQVVGKEVLSGGAHVHGVPEVELLAQLGQHGLLDAAVGGVGGAEEYVVVHLARHLLRRDPGAALRLAVDVTLEEVRDRVVGHVDRRVAQRLDQPLLVAGQLRAQAVGTRAGPLVQPVDRPCQLLLRLGVERLHLLQSLLGGRLPLLVTVVEVPLVGDSDDALVSRAGDDLSVRLVEGRGKVVGDKLGDDGLLAVLDHLPSELADEHLALVESALVRLILGVEELLRVLGAGDLVLLVRSDGREVAERRLDDGLDLDLGHPALLHAQVVPDLLLVLEELEVRVVIHRVARHARHHARALAHRHRGHGQHAHLAHCAERCVQLTADQLRA
mmetsp:Transcript_1029/g.3689  ORF Transcript_1029/g.3689 Transcript_1029/m.3689 type:complete len:473 (+) Transcript_1029:738-2156(+)